MKAIKQGPAWAEWGKPVCVEEVISGELKYWKELPAAPYSIKPDLVVDDPADPDGVLIVDHKSEGGSSDTTHAYGQTDTHTIGQVVLWNETIDQRKGRARRHCNGLVLNFINKRAKANENPRLHVRADVPGWLRDEFIQSRQIDALKFHQPASKNEMACRGRFKRGCPFYRVCFADLERRPQELAYFRSVPWADRPNAPSEFGASRYETLNTCGQKHAYLYRDALVPLIREEADYHNLDTGSGIHLIAAVNFAGGVREDWLTGWSSLPARARAEAIETMENYARWNWGGEINYVMSAEENEGLPAQGIGAVHWAGPIGD